MALWQPTQADCASTAHSFLSCFARRWITISTNKWRNYLIYNTHPARSAIRYLPMSMRLGGSAHVMGFQSIHDAAAIIKLIAPLWTSNQYHGTVIGIQDGDGVDCWRFCFEWLGWSQFILKFISVNNLWPSELLMTDFPLSWMPYCSCFEWNSCLKDLNRFPLVSPLDLELK